MHILRISVKCHIVLFNSKYFSYPFRTTLKERIQAEKKQATLAADQTPAVANPSPVGPAIGTTPTPSMATPLPSSCTPLTVDPKHITPVSQRSQRSSRSHTSKSLNFEMPTHTTTACAARPVSPASSFDSSIHDLGETSVKRKRGRPHKVPTAPTYDDFPENGTEDEKKKWKKRKTAEEWHYKNLHLKKQRNTMKKKRLEFPDFIQKNDKNLFKQHKGTPKSTSTSVRILQLQLQRQKLKKRAE